MWSFVKYFDVTDRINKLDVSMTERFLCHFIIHDLYEEEALFVLYNIHKSQQYSLLVIVQRDCQVLGSEFKYIIILLHLLHPS